MFYGKYCKLNSLRPNDATCLINLGEHGFMFWCIAWCHLAITWSNVKFFCYRNIFWCIINWIFSKKKPQWNLKQRRKTFFIESTCENVLCKLMAILSETQCANLARISRFTTSCSWAISLTAIPACYVPNLSHQMSALFELGWEWRGNWNQGIPLSPSVQNSRQYSSTVNMNIWQ